MNILSVLVFLIINYLRLLHLICLFIFILKYILKILIKPGFTNNNNNNKKQKTKQN